MVMIYFEKSINKNSMERIYDEEKKRSDHLWMEDDKISIWCHQFLKSPNPPVVLIFFDLKFDLLSS